MRPLVEENFLYEYYRTRQSYGAVTERFVVQRSKGWVSLEKKDGCVQKETERDGYSSLYFSPTAETGWAIELVCEVVSQLGLVWFVNAHNRNFRYAPSITGISILTSTNSKHIPGSLKC